MTTVSTPKILVRHVPQAGEALFITVTDRNADAAMGVSREGFEVILPASEDFGHEPVQIGSKIFVLVTEVDSMLFVSRTHLDLPAKLLEGFVPELTSEDVVVMAVARDPGYRTKLAVAAVVQGVDPVAACVGRGGKRVFQAVNLLQGERIEVIAWSKDPSTYLASALAPARVNHVRISKGHATVWAAPHLMAATVGENGQNSLLAGKLLNLKVHVEAGMPPADDQPPSVTNKPTEDQDTPFVDHTTVNQSSLNSGLAALDMLAEELNDFPPIPSQEPAVLPDISIAVVTTEDA